ncbi:N-acetyltransferase [Cytobacillus horneckiae]|uniref:N-acetyltransferase n=2 Tax=Cytobacillus horneckiae TaxID=549687 RepID=A0A2N0ZEV4_9BACI|nr:N-acetyltransferase [Cytobacillus horneckiae]
MEVTMTIQKIKLLNHFTIHHLIEESSEEGYHFLLRLLNEYISGVNRFDKEGEGLYGVYKEDRLIAIGGINIDPYAFQPSIGRLRRFYVSKNARRTGVGTQLLNRIIKDAGGGFKVIVLHTDTAGAADFYTSFGFIKSDRYPQSTHCYVIE